MRARLAPHARTISLAIIAAVALSAGFWWPELRVPTLPDSSALRLLPPDKPHDVVEIVDVDSGILWADSQPAEVTVMLRNRGSRSVTAEVWWILGSIGDPEPWLNPAGGGDPERVRVPAGEIVEVTIGSDDPPPPGSWNLSLWAHVLRGEDRAHSHGVGATPQIRVLSTRADLVRLGQPDGKALISTLQANGRALGLPATGEPDALVSLAAVSQQPIEVQVRCYLSREPHAEPWLAEGVIASELSPVRLDGTATQVAPCTFPDLPPRGQWSLSAFAWRPQGFLPEPPEDAVHMKQPLTLDPLPVTTPDAPPFGPPSGSDLLPFGSVPAPLPAPR